MKNNFVLRQLKIHKPLDQLIPNKRHKKHLSNPAYRVLDSLINSLWITDAMEEKNFKDKILTAIQKTAESVYSKFPLDYVRIW